MNPKKSFLGTASDHPEPTGRAAVMKLSMRGALEASVAAAMCLCRLRLRPRPRKPRSLSELQKLNDKVRAASRALRARAPRRRVAARSARSPGHTLPPASHRLTPPHTPRPPHRRCAGYKRSSCAHTSRSCGATAGERSMSHGWSASARICARWLSRLIPRPPMVPRIAP